MADFYLVAKIESSFGKKGFVKIALFTDFPDRFFDLKEIYIDFFDDKKKVTVEKIEKIKENFFLKIKNFDTDEDVKILLGKEIFIDKEELIELPEDHYFIHDLIGSIVLRNNVEIGRIKDVISSSANDVYVIEDKQNNEILIPAVKNFIESFDPVKRLLILKPGDDLYDDED